MKNIENKNTMYKRVRVSCSTVEKESVLCSEQLHKTNLRNRKERWNCVCSCVCVCWRERGKKGREQEKKRAKNRNLRRHPHFCLALGRREVRRSSWRGGAGRPCCLRGTWRPPLTPCCPWACTRGAQRCCWGITQRRKPWISPFLEPTLAHFKILQCLIYSPKTLKIDWFKRAKPYILHRRK